MDFAQAKIHSLVTVADEEGDMTGSGFNKDPERMKFREVEERFRSQFSMPTRENLVNCTFVKIYVWYIHTYTLFVPDIGGS